MTTLQRIPALCSLLLLACSASSSSGSDQPAKVDAGSPPVADAGADKTPDDPAPAPLKDPAECAGSAACPLCCVTDFAGGAQLYGIVAEECVCEGTGSCAGTCSSDECSSIASKDQVCQDCLNARMRTICLPKADAICAADAVCKLYAQCLAGCH